MRARDQRGASPAQIILALAVVGVTAFVLYVALSRVL